MTCDCDAYQLPELVVKWWEVATPPGVYASPDRDGQGRLVADSSLGVVDAAATKRLTLPERVETLDRILDAYAAAGDLDQIVIWVELNAEQTAVERLLASRDITYSSIFGSLDTDEVERRLEEWRSGDTVALIAKPVMLGEGVNLQRCNKAVFLGVSFKFSDTFQALHRIRRYGQARTCEVHFIHAEAERSVVGVLRRKWELHNETEARMADIIAEHGLSGASLTDALTRSLGVERVEASGEGWILACNDTVAEADLIEDHSVDLIVTSIPFGTLYEYSNCYDEKTEVLTKRGWLSFGELTTEDWCATVNPLTLALEWDQPSAVFWRSYSGPMVHFHEHASLDLLVTPNHRMFAARRSGVSEHSKDFSFITASDMAESFIPRRWMVPVTARPSKGDWPASIDIPQVDQRSTKRRSRIARIETADFMRLAGWYLSEGCIGRDSLPATCDRCGAPAKRDARWCSASCRAKAAHDRSHQLGDLEYQERIAIKPRPRTGDLRGRVSISQSAEVHPIETAEIIALMRRVGLTPGQCGNSITGSDINLASFLRSNFGSGSYNKRIPRWVKDLAPELLEILRDTMMKGDGTLRRSEATPDLPVVYTSFSQQLRDDFQEVCILTGWRARIVAEGTKGHCSVAVSHQRTFPQLRNTPVIEPYEGMIGCATVPNHTLVVRREGRVAVCGNCVEDFGHNDTPEQFWAQMDHLTKHLLRVLAPGRIYACHVKDRIVFGSMTGAGYSTVYPFHAEAILHNMRHGFDFLGQITVTTDVVRENAQSYRLGWTEMCKDGTKMGCGTPEYILLFRAPQSDRTRGYADVPVAHDKADYSRSRWQTDAHAFWRSDGNRLLAPEDMDHLDSGRRAKLFANWTANNVYSYETHVRIGEYIDAKGELPATFMLLAPASRHEDVWTEAEIVRMRTLNTEQSRRNLDMHVCPMAFGLVDRLIERFSNPGDLVYDPFVGIGTVARQSLLAGRRARGVELNGGYFLDAVRYCQAAERKVNTPSLFDLLDAEAATA